MPHKDKDCGYGQWVNQGNLGLTRPQTHARTQNRFSSNTNTFPSEKDEWTVCWVLLMIIQCFYCMYYSNMPTHCHSIYRGAQLPISIHQRQTDGVML